MAAAMLRDMKEPRRPQARWALVGAVLLAITSSSTAIGIPANSHLFGLTARPVHAWPVTLGANLDRSLVAPYREEARTAALAAVAPRERLAAVARGAALAKAGAAAAGALIRTPLWIPSLGINRSVVLFPCWRNTPPGKYLYRWGCAGRNNPYLLAHSNGVFKPLHDAYTSGRLRVGMVAIYADGTGHITRYRVTTW